MTITNTFTVTLEDGLGDKSTYVFNLKHCMYFMRNSPRCIRFVFGTHNLVLHFSSMEATTNYFPLFLDYLEGKIKVIEIDDQDYESSEIEVKE